MAVGPALSRKNDKTSEGGSQTKKRNKSNLKRAASLPARGVYGSRTKSNRDSSAKTPVSKKNQDNQKNVLPPSSNVKAPDREDVPSAMNILTSDELGSVSDATQMLTGNFGDDWGNNDISDASIAKLDGDSNNPLFNNNAAALTAGIGGILGVVGGVNTMMDSEANMATKIGAGFQTAESGATAVNKLTLGVEGLAGGSSYGAGESLSGAAVGIQSAGAVAGAIGDTIGTVGKGIDAYKNYKEGKKYEAAIGAMETLQSGVGAVDKGMKAVHGVRALATGGLDAMGNATKLTGTAGNISTGLGIAGSGVGIAIGGAQMVKGGYDIYQASKVKGDLKKMETVDDGQAKLIDTLIEGQNNNQKAGIENIVEGGIGVTSGVLGILAITGVGAPFAAAVGLIGGLAMGGYKLYKYWKGTRKQKKVDEIVNQFFKTSNNTDYTKYLKSEDGSSFKDYKKTRLADIDEEKKAAIGDKSEADKKQKSKGFFKSVFTSNDSKKSQKVVDMINRRRDKYDNMTEEQFYEEITAVNKVYDDSTHAKKVEAYKQAEKAMKMLEQVSKEDRAKLLKALNIKEDAYSNKKDNGKIISTNDAEKTAMLADELMKILAQKPVTSL